jgi:hypothetical protein
MANLLVYSTKMAIFRFSMVVFPAQHCFNCHCDYQYAARPHDSAFGGSQAFLSAASFFATSQCHLALGERCAVVLD